MSENVSASQPTDWQSRLRNIWRKPDFWVVLLPLIYYIALVRTDFTYGDGPELLTAIYNLGGAHPSGYPLFTMLGYIPSHLPVMTPFWNVAVLLSAVPGAIAIWALYRFLRVYDVSTFVAATAAFIYGMNWHVAYQSTRIEVYALHCMLIALCFWALARFLKPREAPDAPAGPDRGHELRWAYAAVAFACLALTNHLTASFLIVPVIVGLLLGDHSKILKPKTVAILFGIAAACASIYIYLPLQAMWNVGDRISWNDPQTLERFWFHVTGQEYSIFRNTSWDKALPTLEKFWDATNNTFFPGIIIICGIGIYEWIVRHWRSFVCVLLFQLPYLAYVSTYQINDLSTYFTGLFIPVILTFAFGVDWLFKMRFQIDRVGNWRDYVLQFAVVATLGGWIVGLAHNSRTHHFREALAEDMSSEVFAEMDEPAVIFTSVDGHTFPMWYQTYVEHPDSEVVVVDTVMFHLRNKQWYRDFLRKWYPWVNWPDDETALGSRWRQWIVDNNPDLNFYALLNARWPESGSYPVLKGWHHEIVPGTEGKKERAAKMARHIYLAYQADVPGVYFHTSREEYPAGRERIACVAEWWRHDDFSADWTFYGPDGQTIDFKNHGIPKGSNMSWEYLKPEDQTPGEWRCEVETDDHPPIVREFTLTP